MKELIKPKKDKSKDNIVEAYCTDWSSNGGSCGEISCPLGHSACTILFKGTDSDDDLLF